MKKINVLLTLFMIFSLVGLLTGCKKEVVEEPAHTHDFGEWEVLAPATCIATGLKGRDCKGCDKYEREEIAKIEHEYKEVKVIAEPGCENAGSKLLACTHCKDIKIEALAALEHNVDADGVCTKCGAKFDTSDFCFFVVELNGGAIDVEYKETYKKGEVISLANPTKEGYVFSGWYTTSDFVSDSKLGNVIAIDSNVNVYAKWELDGYQVMLNAGTGSVDNDTVVLKDYEVFTLEVPTSDYKFFVGWYLGTEQITDETGRCLKPWDIKDNVELQAKWETEKIVNGVVYMYEGEYPQTVVTNAETIAELTKLTNVNARGYLEYNGNQYAKVVYKEDGYVSFFNNGKQLVNGQTYFFKVEPILWRILDEQNGLVITDAILDTMVYYENDKIHEIGALSKPNNYKYSDINSWLNGDEKFVKDNFITKAFADPIKSLQMTKDIDNSASSTNNSSNPFACPDITTFIYLLSYQEFNYDYNKILDGGIASATDYAIAKGLLVDNASMNGEWWLRSPDANKESLALTVTVLGKVNTRVVNNTKMGVRPAVVLKSLLAKGGTADEK